MSAELLPSWISLGIATFVAAIALLQWRTARQRAAIDFFERRYAVYNEVREVVRMVVSCPTREAFCKFAEAAEQANFLFGHDVNSYLEQLREALLDLETHTSELTPDEQDPEIRKAHVGKARQERNQIEEFRTTGTALFGQYMRFDQKVSRHWLESCRPG
jgi:hypothetical protein